MNWTTPYYANYKQGEIFRWLRYTPLDGNGKTLYQTTEVRDDGGAYTAFSGYEGESVPYQTARFIRVSAVSSGLVLSEVAFQDENGDPYPIQNVISDHDGEKLVDEQDAVPAYPSYFNSTYFDEIYHARTAYEHLHGMSTYEWTHPPLGKVLMMVGIQLFGMTPFGWRFMGALMGVLMLPVMYLMAKQLTKSTKLSFIAMFLMAVDSMHFTQTRIATIDSYAVFWIMLMYFFMFRYFQMRWTSGRDFAKSLITLGSMRNHDGRRMGNEMDRAVRLRRAGAAVLLVDGAQMARISGGNARRSCGMGVCGGISQIYRHYDPVLLGVLRRNSDADLLFLVLLASARAKGVAVVCRICSRMRYGPKGDSTFRRAFSTITRVLRGDTHYFPLAVVSVADHLVADVVFQRHAESCRQAA